MNDSFEKLNVIYVDCCGTGQNNIIQNKKMLCAKFLFCMFTINATGYGLQRQFCFFDDATAHIWYIFGAVISHTLSTNLLIKIAAIIFFPLLCTFDFVLYSIFLVMRQGLLRAPTGIFNNVIAAAISPAAMFSRNYCYWCQA